MSSEKEAAFITELEAASPHMVYAGRPEPEPYQAVWSGKRIFDISPDGSLVKEFREKNLSEFGDKIVIESLGYQGRRVHLAYHKDFYHKYEEQPALWDMEKQDSESSEN